MNCVPCGLTLRPDDILDGSATLERVAAGTDAEAYMWGFRVVCGGCGEVLEARADTSGERIRVVPGARGSLEVLRKRLAAISSRAALVTEVHRVLDSAEGYLLGARVLVPFVTTAFGTTLELRAHARIDPADPLEGAPTLQRIPPGVLRPAGDVTEAELASAMRPPGESGGWVPPIDDPLRFQPSGGWLPPLRPPRRGLLLAKTHLTLRGVWGTWLLCDPPPWVEAEGGLCVEPRLLETCPDDASS